ncbi:porin OmpC [Chimaeribacter californicus]|uniref:Porin OmpC n=1 Tax=Chimaeribacter californicus TaxID=2060067 RepID=A0A2N5DUA4_9GAMM|nr:porin [Chimaeribacter californicus]PLR30372.1 porin OmpC [Chimaeribacter californicus]
MMKRSLLALAVSFIAASGVAHAAEIYNKDGNKLDLYGRVAAKYVFTDNANADGTYVRFGFKGETQITDQLIGYGQWEYNVQANNSEGSDAQSGNKTRLGFAGLKFGEYGSFDYGRNYGVVYDAEAYTDMLPEYGGDSYSQTDNYMTARSSGLATYRNRDFFGLVEGLNFAVQYQGKNDRDGTADEGRGNGDGYGFSVDYQDIGGSGIGVAAAYSNANRTANQKNSVVGGGDRAEAWTGAVKYDANQVYLAAMYAETRNTTRISGETDAGIAISGYANRTQNVEAVAQYQFLNGLRPSVAYVQSWGKEIDGVGDADLVKYAEVGVTYYLNKNMYTYVDYQINLLDEDNALGLPTDNVVTVNLTYRF